MTGTTHVPSAHSSSGASAHGTAAHSSSRTTAHGTATHGTTAHTSSGATAHTSTTHHGLGKAITGYQRDSHHTNHKNYYKYFFHTSSSF
jgi:hypothetical protein